MRLIPRVIRDAVARVTEGRSSKWSGVRNRWIDAHPACAACGNTKRSALNAHHRIPFSNDPTKELDDGTNGKPTNLITLCETGGKLGMNCHLVVGHLGRWDCYNIHVERDAEFMAKRLAERQT